MDEKKPCRRWLSFGIRDLLWAMVVVGMGLAWRAERQNSREAHLEAQKAISESELMRHAAELQLETVRSQNSERGRLLRRIYRDQAFSDLANPGMITRPLPPELRPAD